MREPLAVECVFLCGNTVKPEEKCGQCVNGFVLTPMGETVAELILKYLKESGKL